MLFFYSEVLYTFMHIDISFREDFVLYMFIKVFKKLSISKHNVVYPGIQIADWFPDYSE